MYHLVYTTSPAYVTFSLKATHHPALGQSPQAEIAFPLCHCDDIPQVGSVQRRNTG